MVKQKGAAKNLECMSTSYLGQNMPLQWRCKICGAEFSFAPKRLAATSVPCGNCRKTKYRKICHEQTLKKIIAFLSLRGEQLLSSHFNAHNDPLEILCDKGHKWNTSWASLRHGTRCDTCRKLTFKHPPRKKSENSQYA
jgi:hypothetical protein